MIQSFNHAGNVKGNLRLPGDKSISHRAVMLASMAAGSSFLKNCLQSEDVNSTINIMRKLGAVIKLDNGVLKVTGKGFKNFIKPADTLFAGNSGTSARLISGLLVPQEFKSEITGDDSLSKRPMNRITEPLVSMGADIKCSNAGTLPITIMPSSNLHSIYYEMKVHSAQVKSAIIFSALHLNKESVIIENIPTRDHTEKLLNLEVEVEDESKKIKVSKNNYPGNAEYFVPSDISSAAFLVVLTLLSKKSELILNDVSLNPTRTGYLDVLKKMGGIIEKANTKYSNGEIYGDLIVKSSKLYNITIEPEIIPNIIDEIPILAIAGIFAEGKFILRNAKELRVKESDRIASVVHNLKLSGLTVNEYEDGLEIDGTIEKYDILYKSFGDHRIAMAFSILSLLNERGGRVDGFECVNISNPHFISQLKSIIK